MPILADLKLVANHLLGRFNLRIDTLTMERAEEMRLRRLGEDGYFAKPTFPIPLQFLSLDTEHMLCAVSKYKWRFAGFTRTTSNDVRYTFNNDYFSSPDAEVLYTFVREYHPHLILEIGSGNSTKIIRQAIIDGSLNSSFISVDPNARTEVGHLVDEYYPQRVEEMCPEDLATRLSPGDLLFIDSSHQLMVGIDVPFLLLKLVPLLAVGVIIHIHDIFLPYDYPKQWVTNQFHQWAEQYLVQAMLAYGDYFEVLWAAHYVQRSREDFAAHFPHVGHRTASSLWLRKLR